MGINLAVYMFFYNTQCLLYVPTVNIRINAGIKLEIGLSPNSTHVKVLTNKHQSHIVADLTSWLDENWLQRNKCGSFYTMLCTSVVHGYSIEDVQLTQ